VSQMTSSDMRINVISNFAVLDFQNDKGKLEVEKPASVLADLAIMARTVNTLD
jgi:hypothetical protein